MKLKVQNKAFNSHWWQHRLIQLIMCRWSVWRQRFADWLDFSIPPGNYFFPWVKQHNCTCLWRPEAVRGFPGTPSSPASVSRGLGQQTGHSEATFLNPVCRWTPVVVLNPAPGRQQNEERDRYSIVSILWFLLWITRRPVGTVLPVISELIHWLVWERWRVIKGLYKKPFSVIKHAANVPRLRYILIGEMQLC